MLTREQLGDLQQGAQALGVPLHAAQLQTFADYVALLLKWNAAYNLTAIRDPREIITHHLLDSLAVVPHLHPLAGGKLLDVGSGAGFPGLVIAIASPDRQVTLLDSNGKKTRFLTQAKLELRLANVEVVQSRTADFQPAEKFDCITARAVCRAAELVRESGHVMAEGGRWLLLKAARAEISAECAELPPQIHSQVRELSVPGLNAERHLLLLTR